MKGPFQLVGTNSFLAFPFSSFSRRARLELPFAAALFAGLAAVAPGQAPTPTPTRLPDVVILVNDDRVTGEIRSYSGGRLKVATDHEGDVLVKWNKIRSVTSHTLFDVEMTSGVHYYGSLAPSDPPGKLSIVGPTTVTVGYLEVFRLTPVRRTFWRRIDGSLDLGFNYTQASQLVQFNLDADATYRMRDWALRADLSAFFSRSEGVTASDRATFSIFYTRFLADRWLVGGGLGFDRNLELGLDLRSLVEVGAGRKIIQTNQTLLIALLGLSVNHEDPLDGEGKNNAEALISAQYTLFTYDFPKMNFDASLNVFPSLTESGRVRVEVAVSGRREIARDFYLSLSIFDSFDSKDPSTGESRNDWGPVLAVGWTF